MRLLVPLYEHPHDRPEAWRQLTLAAPRLYGVVLNPANGPGTAPDPGFTAAAAALRSAGVRLLGYADTGYGRRPATEVLADLHRHRRWYGADGAFLDQTAAEGHALPGYRALTTAARRDAGMRTLALNPGVHPDPRYADLADLLVTFEGTWESYRNAAGPPRWARSLAPERVCHLVYGVPHGQGARTAALAGRRGAGVCCAVRGTLPHPWDGVPEGLAAA